MSRVTPSLFTKDALTQIEADSVTPRQNAASACRNPRLRDLSIARTKSEFVPGTHVGFWRGKGTPRQVIYFLCPFHREKTPSCVAYFRGRPGNRPFWCGYRKMLFVPGPTRTTHFHCYGCKREGSHAELVRKFQQPYTPLRHGWDTLSKPVVDVPF